MRAFRSWLPALLLTAAVPSFAQSGAARPELPKDPKALLAMAEAHDDFNNPSLKPWHFRASYLLYDESGHPAEEGTLEYWWVSPGVDRSTWTRGSIVYTEWHTAAGKRMTLLHGAEIHPFEEAIPRDLLNPLPGPVPYDPGKEDLERIVMRVGTVDSPCVRILSRKQPPLGFPPDFKSVYCFKPDAPAVVFRAARGIQIQYSDFKSVQGRDLPRSMVATVSGRALLAVKVETIERLKADDPALEPDVGAKPDGTFYPDLLREIPQRVSGEMPHYPDAAKKKWIQGEVLLEAKIGQDGRVEDVEVIGGADWSLEYEARKTVSQWTWQPYRLAGRPVAARMLLTLMFKIGQPASDMLLYRAYPEM